MNKILMLIAISMACHAQPRPGPDVFDFSSSVLDRTVTLRVLVPPDYKLEEEKYYPLFLFVDGENIFSGTTSFMNSQEWLSACSIQNNQCLFQDWDGAGNT